jgi:mannose-6-phosphate isomerase-like protein (cupin superfamily)
MIVLLANGLAARGIDVTVFPTNRGRVPDPLHTTNDTLCGGKTDTCEAEASRCLDISDVFDHADDFDLIHNHAGVLPLTCAGVVKRPIITTLHGCTSGKVLPIFRKYNGRSYYVAVGNARRAEELTYAATVYYGIDVESFTFNERASSYVLFCGNVDQESGVSEAIQIARVAGQPLVIAGEIEDERFFTESITPLLDGERVRYVGPEQTASRNELLGNATALLHPVSCDEPFDFSILEANACGTPVVAFARGLLPEIIAEGINGFAVPDIPAAADALKSIHSLSRSKCRHFAEEKFSPQRMVDDYLRVYEEVIERTKTEDRRPWGYYVVLSDLPDHKVKRIVVWPGKRLSLQSHRLRSEHWTIIAGSPVVTVNGEEIPMQVGQSIDIPVGAEHRIYNPGQDPVVFIEVQMGVYFGEDDIVRFEDDFGRF